MRKITLCLWLISGLFASFTSDAQDNSILLPQEKIRLSEAFDLIEGQSGYTVAYNEELLNINRKVLPPPTESGLEDTFRALLKDTGMKALIYGKIILIIPLDSHVGEDGLPDSDLSRAHNIIDEAIVVGYGSMSKKDISSAIGTYNPMELECTLLTGAEALLQGRLAGVNVQASSGSLYSRNRVSIRGIGSLTAGNEPLYVVDGIPISNTTSDAGGWEGEQLNSLTDINPDDIESIQVDRKSVV